MWPEFVLAALLTILFLFVPGYFFFRGIGFSRILSVAAAPMYTAAAYAITCIAYGIVGVPCTWVSVLAPALVVAAVVFVVPRVLRKSRDLIAFPCAASGETRGDGDCEGAFERNGVGKPKAHHAKREGAEDWLCLCLYLAVGLVVGWLVFLFNLSDAASYNQFYDNAQHLSILQSFAGSDRWSSLGITMYQLPGDEPLLPSSKIGFYPSAWHDIGAMVASCGNIGVAIVENAVNFVFLALVFPASMFALMRWVFAGRRAVVWMCGLLVMAAGAFPWRFMTFGPLFPNLASMAVMPMAALAFVIMVGEGMARRARVVACFTFVVGCAAAALLQPNTIFALAVFLCPYCVARVYSSTLKRFDGKPHGRMLAVAFSMLFALAAVVLWVVAYNLPALASIVTYNWPALVGMARALLDAAVMNYVGVPPQLLFALLAVIGGVYSILHRRYLWLAVSYVIFSLIFAVSEGSDGVLKQVLAGFWYTDYNRIGALAAVCAMPLAAMGAAWIAEGAAKLASRSRAKRAQGDRPGPDAGFLMRTSGIVVGALVAACLYVPVVLYDAGAPTGAALAVITNDIRICYDNDNHGTFDEPEQEFVDEVMDIVPDGTAIVNVPYDGSVFAFASEGTDAVFRTFRDVSDIAHGTGGVIRDRLQDVASDEEVAAALRDAGAEYFMLLDSDPQNGFTVYPHEDYEPLWSHLLEIDENTPGFELVLSRDDMKLFRILPVAE